MPQSLQEIIQAAQALSPADRAELLLSLTVIWEGEEQPPLNEYWQAEIQRRSDDFDAGRAGEPIPWSEVKARARREVMGRG